MARKRPGRKGWANGIISTNDVKNKKVKILVSGGPGTGKTNLIGSAPRPFVIAAEDGLLTLHKLDLPYFKLDNTMAVFETTLMILESAKKRERVEISEGEFLDFNEIDTLCLDSTWMLNTRLATEIKEESGRDKFQHGEWGILLDRMQRIIMELLESDYHVICTIGEAVKTDQMDDSKKEVSFNMSGGFRHEIAYLFDFNLTMAKEAVGRRIKYKMFTNDNDNRQAKARVDLPLCIEDPTFDKIYLPMMEQLK